MHVRQATNAAKVAHVCCARVQLSCLECYGGLAPPAAHKPRQGKEKHYVLGGVECAVCIFHVCVHVKESKQVGEGRGSHPKRKMSAKPTMPPGSPCSVAAVKYASACLKSMGPPTPLHSISPSFTMHALFLAAKRGEGRPQEYAQHSHKKPWRVRGAPHQSAQSSHKEP